MAAGGEVAHPGRLRCAGRRGLSRSSRLPRRSRRCRATSCGGCTGRSACSPSSKPGSPWGRAVAGPSSSTPRSRWWSILQAVLVPAPGLAVAARGRRPVAGGGSPAGARMSPPRVVRGRSSGCGRKFRPCGKRICCASSAWPIRESPLTARAEPAARPPPVRHAPARTPGHRLRRLKGHATSAAAPSRPSRCSFP